MPYERIDICVTDSDALRIKTRREQDWKLIKDIPFSSPKVLVQRHDKDSSDDPKSFSTNTPDETHTILVWTRKPQE